jgi:hypothetical protein
VLLVLQVQALMLWSRTPYEWATGGAIMVVGLALSLTALQRLRSGISTAATDQVAIRHSSKSALNCFSEFLRNPQLFAVLHFAWLCVLLGMILALLIDGRYRPLPWVTVLGPAVLLLSLSLLSDLLPRSQRYLSACLALSAPLIMVAEGPQNIQAWLFTALLLLTAAASLIPKRLQ